jgi:beta-xylosidase
MIRRVLALLAAAAALAAAPASAQQAAGQQAAAQQPAAPRFAGPVLPTNFADPFILAVGDRFLAYATNAHDDRANVPVAFSTDLLNWSVMAVPGDPDRFHDALPALPAWAQRGRTWAPEVLRVGNRYILYFSAHHRVSGRQCIGAAAAADPRGPFVPQGTEPLVCQLREGGTIDASPFRDADGKLYLYFKNDGNAVRAPTQLWGQRMGADGLSLEGEPAALGRNDTPWEGSISEAPFMVRRGDAYILFFSANDYAWQERERLSRYATGYARCTGPLGPCTDAPENPILASRRSPDCLSGPGHPAVFEAGGRHYMVFHAWAARSGCRKAGEGRFMHIRPIEWNGDAPVVAGPAR